MDKQRAKTYLSILIPLFAYFLAYTIASVEGEYKLSFSGLTRYKSGWGIPDRHQWEPWDVRWNVKYEVDGSVNVEANDDGWLFVPLITVDRALFHKTMPIPVPEQFKILLAPAPADHLLWYELLYSFITSAALVIMLYFVFWLCKPKKSPAAKPA